MTEKNETVTNTTQKSSEVGHIMLMLTLLGVGAGIVVLITALITILIHSDDWSFVLGIMLALIGFTILYISSGFYFGLDGEE